MNNADKNQWMRILKPKYGLFDIDLKELWFYRDLITLFVRRDIVSKYKQTILGPLWFVVQPVLTTLMFTVVFGNIANIPTDGIPHIAFYLAGIVPWTYFATCLNETSTTFTKNATLFGKVYFPRLAMPISVVIASVITFVIQFLLFVAILIYFYSQGTDISIGVELLLLPVLVLIIAGLGLGFGIIISSLTTKYRDLTHLVRFGVQLWMYATPIIYPLSEIPEKYKVYVMANPMTPIVENFKTIMIGVGDVNYMSLLYSFGFMVVLLFVGIVVFNKIEGNFMDTV